MITLNAITLTSRIIRGTSMKSLGTGKSRWLGCGYKKRNTSLFSGVSFLLQLKYM